MFPPFPQELAYHYCLSLIKLIEKGDVLLEQVAVESEERKGQGFMLGCLVGWDKIEKKRVIVYAVSGNARVLKFTNSQQPALEGLQIANSIVSIPQINSALAQNDGEIHRLTEEINGLPAGSQRSELITRRTKLTDQSLSRVFNLYNFTRFDGRLVTLPQIIRCHDSRLPPTGTGDCCAPKLLTYAFQHKLQIVSMDEVYYGRDTKNKTNGTSYPPCDERCGYILPSILGVEILYRDNDIIVVNKESGLLSVPGRGEDKADCVEARVRALFPDVIQQPAVHRLDMETSGILVLARNKEAHKNLEMQFAAGMVHKKYEALLDGILKGRPEGHIELKFRLDLDNRPHQIYDEENGNIGITDWKKLGVEKWTNPETGEIKTVTKVLFEPKTGRTHQLRLASSHEKGLGIPILGDSLYGKCKPGERLMLHACEIEFKHPKSGEIMKFCNSLYFKS